MRAIVSRTPLVFLALALGACRGGFQVRNYPTPVSLYDAGLEQMRLGKFDNAIAALDQATILLGPRDSLLPKAHYMLAQALTKRKHFLLAATSYKRIVDDFPDDSLADDAVIGMGDSYTSAWRGPGYDRAHATDALQAYGLLPRLFPASPLVKRAHEGEVHINEQLARADYNTGIFYIKRKADDSALIYFKDVVALYPGTTAARDALLKMIEVYKRLHYVADAADACRALRASYPAGVDVAGACATILADTTK
jgi:outer membrane protein assembly factor BamD